MAVSPNKTRYSFPKQIRFSPESARRIVPGKLVARGLFATREEARRALELVISMAEKEGAQSSKED